MLFSWEFSAWLFRQKEAFPRNSRRRIDSTGCHMYRRSASARWALLRSDQHSCGLVACVESFFWRGVKKFFIGKTNNLEWVSFSGHVERESDWWNYPTNARTARMRTRCWSFEEFLEFLQRAELTLCRNKALTARHLISRLGKQSWMIITVFSSGEVLLTRLEVHSEWGWDANQLGDGTSAAESSSSSAFASFK